MGLAPGGAGIDQSVRYPLDEIGSDVSTLLGPAVVLVAIVATLRIALSQLDQTATTESPSPPRPRSAGGRPTWGRSAWPARRGPLPVPVMATPVPAGFQWIDAAPAPKVRAGFALVVILAFLGALLAMAVAGLVVGAAVAVQSI